MHFRHVFHGTIDKEMTILWDYFFHQNFFQASKYIPDICVIRAVQKIVWASGCGTVQLVFSSNEDISKIYEKVSSL